MELICVAVKTATPSRHKACSPKGASAASMRERGVRSRAMNNPASLLRSRPRTLQEAQSMVTSIRDALAAADLVLRAPPEIPDTCCGRGCNGCVWEGYYAALLFWRDDAAQLLGGANEEIIS